MDIHEIDCYDAPRPAVFYTLRDRYQEYLRHIPLVSSVELVESEELDPARLRTITEWRGNAYIPSAYRNKVKPEMIRWRIHSLWDEERWINDWRMETFHFESIFECYGTLRFEEEGARTRCTLAAIFHIDVPVIGPVVEKYVIKNILNKSLMINGRAVRKLLREDAARGRGSYGKQG